MDAKQTIAALDLARRTELTGGSSHRGRTLAALLYHLAQQGEAIAAALTRLDGQRWTYAHPDAGAAMNTPTTLGWQPWHRADGMPLAFWWYLRDGRVLIRPGVSPSPANGQPQEFYPLGRSGAECTAEQGRFVLGNAASIARAIHRRVITPAAPHWTTRLSQAAKVTGQTIAARAAADRLAAALPNAERLPDNPLRPGLATVRLKHWAGNHDIIVNDSGRVDFPALSVDRATALAIAAALRSMPG